MDIRELTVPGAVEVTPRQYSDDRGLFVEWFRGDLLSAAVGHAFEVRQANTSVSRRGVVRGIHYADVPPGQAKYVTVTQGAGIDYVVDIRAGSPTFGQWDSVHLDAIDRRAVFIPAGLGHAFVAITDDATLTYLVSDTYNPAAEHDISPVDREVGLVFPVELGELLLSPKDRSAPSLSDRLADGSLPDWDECVRLYASQRGDRS